MVRLGLRRTKLQSMHSPEYLDGLFDGEGCVYWDGRGIRVSVTNTYKPVLDEILMWYGGSVRRMANKIWRWEASGSTAVEFLEHRMECSIKADQIVLAIDIAEGQHPPAKKRTMIAKLKKLKKVRFSR